MANPPFDFGPLNTPDPRSLMLSLGQPPMRLLQSPVGGPGTGRPGLLSRAGSAIFGADPTTPMPPQDQTAALRNALFSAGAGMVESAGGPRRWGEFAPSPIASVMAGLAAGRETYAGAQGQSRQRGLLDAFSAPGASAAQRQNSLLGMLIGGRMTGEAAGAVRQAYEMTQPTPEKLYDIAPGGNLVDATGRARFSAPLKPVAPTSYTPRTREEMLADARARASITAQYRRPTDAQDRPTMAAMNATLLKMRTGLDSYGAPNGTYKPVTAVWQDMQSQYGDEVWRLPAAAAVRRQNAVAPRAAAAARAQALSQQMPRDEVMAQMRREGYNVQ
jgi:hypothetical protein